MSAGYRKLPQSAGCQPQNFTVQIADGKLEEFRQCLGHSKIGPVTYEGLQQDRRYGITREWLKGAKEKWLSFDWRTLEKDINSFPNYKLPIADHGTTFDIHFIALFSEREDAVPITLVHGWPGSFLEFLPILRILKARHTPANLPYHIVIPSLPGYAFSSRPPLDRDFGLEDVARVVDKLMVALGFAAGYVAQGGDIGSFVARILGGSATSHARAVHLNFAQMADPGGAVPDGAVDAAERRGLERADWFLGLGSAYAVMHATRPATVGLVLSASPLALLAWVGEKYLDWTDWGEDAGGAAALLDVVLASVTLYWLTDTFPSSVYPYRQLFLPGVVTPHADPRWHIHKPLAFSWFPKEILPIPRAWVETTGNLVWHRQHQSGGHFAALERPAVLLQDLEDFIAQVWPVA